MTIKKTLQQIAGTAILATIGLASINEAEAASIFNGARGPTNWQLDQRVSYTQRNTSPSQTETFSENTILKYWSGDKLGAFGFANMPTKAVSKGDLSSRGIGDLTLGFGPRGRIDFGDKGNLHFISYAGLALATGNENAKPALGNGRVDEKLGLFTTYLSKNKKFEIDTFTEYSFVGKDKYGKKASDELALGIVSGGEIAKNIRLVGGLTGVIKQGGKNDGDYSLGPRINMRYIFSPRVHAEIIGDYYAINRNMPSGFGITALIRVNMGKMH